MHLPKHLLPITFLTLSISTAAYYLYTQTQKAFAAEGLDLTIGNTSYYNGEVSNLTTWLPSDLDDGNGPSLGQYLFFNFTDVKPGDTGEDTIELTAQGSDYFACVDLTLTENNDNQTNEPELTDGDTPDDETDLFDGELGSAINLLFWADDGDNVFETEETIIEQGDASTILDSQWTLADSTSNIFTGSGPLIAGTSYYIAKAWCFGELIPDPLVQDNVNNIRTPVGPEGPGVTCTGDLLNNLTQTDTLKADIEFLAVQADVNPDYSCGDCTIVGEFGADAVITWTQGLRKNNTPVLPERSNPDAALGDPEGNAATGTFFSLGFGGTVTFEYDNPIEDIAGNDIYIHEITNGVYPEETVEVFVSQDGVNFESLGEATNQGPQPFGLDISVSSFDWIKYIKLVDTSNPADFPDAIADGFDLDGIIVGNQNVCEREI